MQMFFGSSKTLSRRIIRLLLLLPWFGQAQERADNDSTFNGIDYFAGRIARGFGGGVAQEVSDKEHGARFFLTTPSLYGSAGNRFGVRLSNSTRWTQLEEGPDAAISPDEILKYTTHGTSVEAQYRLASGLQIMGVGTFQRNDLGATTTNELEITDKTYGLRSLFLSRRGRLAPAPEQLAHVYYATPDHRLLQDQVAEPGTLLSPGQTRLGENPVALLSPGQSMLSLLGAYNDLRYNTRRTITSLAEQSNLSRSFYSLDADFIHALNKQVTVGMLLEPVRQKTQNSLLREYPDQPAFASQSTGTLIGFSVAPRLDYLSAPQLLHRFHAAYGSSRANSSTIVNAQPSPDSLEDKLRSWKASYAFHYLGNVASPSVRAFLADENHVFGNRLPAHAFHLIGRASYHSSKNEAPYFSNGQPGGSYGPEWKNQQHEFSATGIYGLSSGVEIGGRADYVKYTETSTYFAGVAPSFQRNENISWNYNLVLSFANYRYEEKYKDRFGWDNIREFDRLYGPLLLTGMIKGELAAQYMDLSNSFEDATDAGSQIQSNFHSWLVEASFRCGLTDHLELDLLWQTVRAVLFSPDPPRKSFELTLIWQPWQSVRLQIGRSRSRPPIFPLGFSAGRANELWSVQLLSLF